jgi:hypothetical protein
MSEQEPSRRQQIRTEVLNQTLGKWMRVVDLLLDHHADEGLPVHKEARLVAKRAVILMVGNMLTEEDAVMLLESSRMRLPRKLEESTDYEIRRWIEGTRDDDAHPDLALRRDPRPGDD